MAVTMLLLALLSLAADTVKSAPADPTAALTCTENGFYAVVTFNAVPAGTTQKGDVTLGTGGSGCAFPATAGDKTIDTSSGGTDTTEVGTSGSPILYSNCGVSSSNTNPTTIKYEVDMDVVITETVSSAIVRSYKYQFKIDCSLTRAQTEAGTVSFTVDSTLVLEGTAVDKDRTFDLGIDFDFLDRTDPATPVPQSVDASRSFSVNNKDTLYLRVKETTSNGDFKFTVQSCFASGASDPAAAASGITYDLIDDECPQDDTVTITPGTAPQEEFNFEMRAFYMSGSAADAGVYVHCELFICKTAENDDNADTNDNSKCVQDTAQECTDRGRKRRSVEDSSKTLMTSANQHFQVVLSAARCRHNYVFDSSINACTNERLILIKGLYMDIEWNERYGNASSNAFKHFARVTGSYLEYLINNANKDDVIKGVKIVQARKGSVIVDVLITYAESVDAGEAFKIFEEVMYKTTPQMTRVVEFLNIRQDKVIEYVPVVVNKNINMEMILIIVIVAAVILISFISGISLYKIRLGRSQASPPATINNSFDNKAMENI